MVYRGPDGGLTPSAAPAETSSMAGVAVAAATRHLRMRQPRYSPCGPVGGSLGAGAA